jgi:hypothetical protein
MSVFGAVRRAVVASGRGSQATALANARAACTDLSRRRVERAEVDAFLALAWASPPASAGRRHRRA